MKKSKVCATHDKKKAENLSTPSIQNFFKSVPKSLEFSTNVKLDEGDDTKAVYIEALKKKLQGKRTFDFRIFFNQGISITCWKFYDKSFAEIYALFPLSKSFFGYMESKFIKVLAMTAIRMCDFFFQKRNLR